MASVNIKVIFESNDQVKTFRMPTDSSVNDFIREIQTKVADIVGVGTDHGLFQPATKTKKARWLKPNRSLKFYDINTGSEVYYKKKHRILRVILLDESQKSVLIDSSKNIKEIIKIIGQKLILKDYDQYGLRRRAASESDWLDPEKTLYEEDIAEDEVLIFAKKLFANDFNVDTGDPMQLHLIYVQSTNAVVSGKYDPLQRSEVIDLAAMHLQVIQGNYDQNKHKSSTVDLSKVLPSNFRKGKRLEKDIFREWGKLVGTSEINAKYRYVQIVRALKTYGVSFFDVLEKSKNNKKKGLRTYIGITRDSILKLDYETREVIKEWKLEQLRRWAATNNSLTLDFGDYEDNYFVLVTTEGEQMSRLIGGYIDLILKNQTEINLDETDDDGKVAVVSSVAYPTGIASSSVINNFLPSSGINAVERSLDISTAAQYVSSKNRPQIFAVNDLNLSGSNGYSVVSAYPKSQKMQVTDILSSLNGLKVLEGEIMRGIDGFVSNSNFAPEKWREQLLKYEDLLKKESNKLSEYVDMDKWDTHEVENVCMTMFNNTLGLAVSAKHIASLDKDLPVLNGALNICKSISGLVESASKGKDYFKKEYSDIQRALEINSLALKQINKLEYCDIGTEALINGCLNDIDVNHNNISEIILCSADEIQDPVFRGKLVQKAQSLKSSNCALVDSMRSLAPVIYTEESQSQFNALSSNIKKSTLDFSEFVDSRLTGNVKNRLKVLTGQIGDSLEFLENVMNTTEKYTCEIDFDVPTGTLLNSLSEIRENIDNPKDLIAPTKTAVVSSNQLITSCESLAKFSEFEGSERLLNSASVLGTTCQELMDEVRMQNKNPGAEHKKRILALSSRIEAYSQDILSGGGVKSSQINLRYNIKNSIAKVLKLKTAALSSLDDIKNKSVSDKLSVESAEIKSHCEKVITELRKGLKMDDLAFQDKILQSGKSSIVAHQKYLTACRNVLKSVENMNNKQEIKYACDEVSDSIKGLEKACAVVSYLGGQAEIEEAMIDFGATQADLDSTEIWASQGILSSAVGSTLREGGFELLNLSSKNLNTTLESLVASAQVGGNLSSHIRDAAASISQLSGATRAMASTVPDRVTQKSIITSAKRVLADTMDVIASARNLYVNRNDKPSNETLLANRNKLKSSLASLISASKGLDTREVDIAINDLRTESSKLSGKALPASVPYAQAIEELSSVSKALRTASSQLPLIARSNPRNLGNTSKMVSSTFKQFIRSINISRGSASDSDVNNIVESAKKISSNLLGLLESTKLYTANRDPTSMDALNKANEKVSDSIQEIISLLGNSVPPECEEAISVFLDNISNLNTTVSRENVPVRSLTQLTDEFALKSQSISEIVQHIVGSSRVSASKLGLYSKESASLFKSLTESARSALLASKVEDGSCRSALNKEFLEIHKLCDSATTTNGHGGVVKVAEKIVKLSQKTLKDLRKTVDNLEIQDETKRHLLNIFNEFESSIGNLSEAIASGKDVKTINNAVLNVSETLRNIESAMDDSFDNINDFSIDRAVAEDLINVTKEIGVSNIALIRASIDFSADKKNESAAEELRKATSGFSSALTKLINAYSVLNPGIKELRKLEKALNNHIVEQEAVCLALGANKSIPITSGDHKNQLSSCTKELNEHIIQIVNKIKEEPQNLAQAVRSCRMTVESLIENFKGTFAEAPVNLRRDLSNIHTELLDSLVQFTKAARDANKQDENSMKKLNSTANNSGHVLSNLLGLLQTKVAVVSDINKLVSDIENGIELMDESSSLSTENSGKRYNDYKESLDSNVSVLTDIVNRIISTDSNMGSVGLAISSLGEVINNVIQDSRGAALTTADVENASVEIIKGSKDLLRCTSKLVENAKNYIEDPTNKVLKASLQDSAPPIFSSIANLLSQVKKGALGEIQCDQAIDNVNRSIAQVTTASIFSQAGQLRSTAVASSNTITSLQIGLIHAVENSQKRIDELKRAINISQEAVGKSALELSKDYHNVNEAAINVSSRLEDSKVQQSLLSGAKMIGLRVQQLIIAARGATNTRQGHNPQHSTNSASETLYNSLAQLIDTCQVAAMESSAGENQIGATKQKIMSLIRNIPGYDSATPDDTIKACREFLKSISGLVFSQSQEDIILSCEKVYDSAEKVINSSSTLARSAPPATQKIIRTGLETLSQKICKLLDVAKNPRGDPDSESLLEEASGETTQAIQQLVDGLNDLPDVGKLVLDEAADLELLANAELEKSALIIEEAAAILMKSKNAYSPRDPTIMDENSISDAIMTSAIAITQSTGVLVKSASQVQKERGTSSYNRSKKYHNDPTWANGLISAARAVSNAVRMLVDSANGVCKGTVEQEALIAATRAVVASTAQLVSASRVRADTSSEAHINLENGAKAVTAATSNLVSTAQKAVRWKEDQESNNPEEGFTNFIKAKFDQQIRILKLEAEIEKERRRLGSMNRNEYNSN